MDKKERKRLLKRIASGPEIKALEDLFNERKDNLKEEAINEDKEISQVIGRKKAIDNLDKIIKIIKRSKKKKSNKSKNANNYVS